MDDDDGVRLDLHGYFYRITVAEGLQTEGRRFKVGWSDADGIAEEAYANAEAVEYLGPDDALPRRWPERADFWEHAHLPLDHGA